MPMCQASLSSDENRTCQMYSNILWLCVFLSDHCDIDVRGPVEAKTDILAISLLFIHKWEGPLSVELIIIVNIYSIMKLD